MSEEVDEIKDLTPDEKKKLKELMEKDAKRSEERRVG